MSASEPSALARAELPRGFVDRDALDIAGAEAMMAEIRAVYELYGFEAVETPFVEFTEALGKFLPDLDRPNEGVFSFQDDDDRWLSLRYDLTAPLARYVAENYDRLPKPYRSFRAGWVFRNEKPGPGRYRQFMQFDADTVGSASPAADAEICMMAADCLEALGVPRRKYVIKVNSRKVLDGVLEAINLGGGENLSRRLTVLRAIDKADKIGIEGVKALLGTGRLDESGDFTRGANLAEDQIGRVLALWNKEIAVLPGEEQPAFIGTSGPFGVERTEDAGASRDMEPAGEFSYISNTKTLEFWGRMFKDSPPALAGIEELRQVILFCEAAGFGSQRIRVDSSVVRGLEYYTGPVFEAELTFEVKDEAGRPVRFGSVGGGGRYDGLVARFRPEPVPATGFSIGVSRLLAALRGIESPVVGEAARPGPVVVAVLDRDRASMANYQRLVANLRKAKPPINAELYLGAGGLNAQLKYADKRGSLCAVIQGSNERSAAGGPQVVIRDLALGAELAKASKERADYVQLRQRAQIAAPEAELVARVREVIARKGAPLLGS